MIDVEDWAEIRRLRRAEQMSIKAIGGAAGRRAEHGAGGDPFAAAAEV